MKRKTTTDKELSNLSFEVALEQLENIAQELEQGELSLENSLTKFAEGMSLSQICLTKLSAAEKQMDKIIEQEQGKIIERPLDLLGEEKC